MKINNALQFFYPSPTLYPIVHHFQWMRFDTQVHAETIDMMPSFGLGLIFYFWKGQTLIANSKLIRQHTVPRVVVQASSTYPIQGSNFDSFDMVRVLFQPGQMHKVFPHIPIHVFQNEVPDAALHLNPELGDLYEQMQAAAEVPQKIVLLDNWIYKQLTRNRIEKAIYPHFSKLLQQAHGKPSTVQHMANTLGLSRQHLNRLLKQQLGFTTQQSIRVHRFNQVMPYFHQQTAVSLSETAHRFGYADQAHFTRDFKRYTGTTPAAYLRKIWDALLL